MHIDGIYIQIFSFIMFIYIFKKKCEPVQDVRVEKGEKLKIFDIPCILFYISLETQL